VKFREVGVSIALYGFNIRQIFGRMCAAIEKRHLMTTRHSAGHQMTTEKSCPTDH